MKKKVKVELHVGDHLVPMEGIIMFYVHVEMRNQMPKKYRIKPKGVIKYQTIYYKVLDCISFSNENLSLVPKSGSTTCE